MDRTAFSAAIEHMGLSLEAAQLDRFEGFEAALYEANQTKNLTRVPRDACWRRHFADSLLLAEFLLTGVRVLDLGTGPGFPAWPLALARPDLQVTALDSNGKMLSFLKSNPLPNLVVSEGRAESWKTSDPYDVVTGRAVAPLTIQLEISAPLCKVGGLVLPFRTPSDRPVPTRVQPLGIALESVNTRVVSGDDAERVFPAYRKVAQTGSRYPRSWAEVRRSPLRGEGYEPDFISSSKLS
jgi:16S rRNA (guanine527-N7)-methyltransferase